MNAYDAAFRTVPENIEAEQAVLGAVLVNNAAFDVIARFLEPKHFHEQIHQMIFEVAGRMLSAGKGVNPITLKTFLPANVKIGRGEDEISLPVYLARLAGNASGPVMVRDYAAAVHDAWIAREAIGALQAGVDIYFNLAPDKDPLAAFEPVENMMAQLRSERIRSENRIGIGKHYLDEMTAARQRGSVRGVPICLREIEEVISEPCFEAGNLYGLLSSSGEGKTSLTLQMILHAIKKGHPVQFLSFDQSSNQCIRQMVAQEYGIEARRQRFTDLSEKEWEKVVDFGTWIDRQPFEVIKCTDQNAGQLVGLARTFVKRHGNDRVPLIVVDHIGSVTPEDKRADEGTKAKNINKVFKAGAEMTDAAWLALNQRNSYGMKRDNPRPISADLFGGDPAKQAYDAIFYVYRYMKFLEERKDVASSGSDWKKIEAIFPSAVRGGEDIAQVGAIKVRFGNPAIKRNLIFEARLTRYASDAPPVLQESMEGF